MLNKYKFFFMIFSFFICLNCNTQNLYDFENNEYYFVAYYNDLINPPFKLSFIKSKFYCDIPELDLAKLEEGEFIKANIEGNYKIEMKEGFTYFFVNEKKYLVLYYKSLICILIDCSNNDAFFGINKNSKYITTGEGIRDNSIGISKGMWSYQKTSSIFTETISGKKIEYNGSGKYYFQVTSPWIEGKSDYGIDEWIEKEIISETDEILFFNGFINPNRPDLYYANSRVKKIKITCNNNNWSYIIEDTANPQIIKLPEKINGIIRFTIEDIYKGTKYSDTTIAGIYFLRKFNK